MDYELITMLITPFDDSKNIDLNELKKLIKDIDNKGNNGFILGSDIAEYDYLKEDEFIDLIKLANDCSENKIYINAFENNIDIINKINDYKLEGIILNINNLVNLENIIKKYQNNKFILSVNKNNIDQIMDKITNNKNVIGLVISELEIIDIVKKKYPFLRVYYKGDKNILGALKRDVFGVISTISNIYINDIKELIEDYKNNIENDILDNYINVISNMFDGNCLLIKYALSKLGYKSMNSRMYQKQIDKNNYKDIDIILNS